MINELDLAQLKRLAIFACVVEQNSFAKAAEYLGISRSSVSEQVAILEKELGVRLLQRTTRQLTLTREGEEIYPEAKCLPTLLRNVTEMVGQELPKGLVRITSAQDFAIKWLNPRLRAFRRQYPDIYFDLILNDNILDLVANQVDLGVRIGPVDDDSLIARPLFQDRPKIVASTAYLQQLGTPNDIETLQQHDWILLSQMNRGNRVTLQNNGQILDFIPQRFHVCDAPMIMCDMIESGMGLGLHLGVMLEKEFASGSMQQVMPEWHGDLFTCSLVYSSRRQMPLRTRCVVNFLVEDADAASL
ncbi:MAG: LysR family transcriptional regulator [Gammaproteobacteria bacterium]|nr:LysR family transcriptional regulator [Gammaproteobacteria bacterium]MBU1724794.1 LysR family transcriptional regulator [Gammaproteobacteria bacterium]MBU2006543.1 LysR family transcriptional regulator [Gammaproteobacteria bacterium]